jgi:hypothetical protein
LIDHVIKKGTQLNVATQGVSGLERAGKSTARAFHWPSLPVCGGLATFNCPDTFVVIQVPCKPCRGPLKCGLPRLVPLSLRPLISIIF